MMSGDGDGGGNGDGDGSYGMGVTTLEEVFLRVANGTTITNGHGETADHDMGTQRGKSLEMQDAVTTQVSSKLFRVCFFPISSPHLSAALIR